MNPSGVLAKIQKVRTLMQQFSCDGILLRKRRNFSWLTDGKINSIVSTTEQGVADLLILEDQFFCITTRMELARLQEEELANFPGEWIVSEWYEGIENNITSLCRGKKIGVDGCWSDLGLPDGVDLSREIAGLAYVLTPSEIDRYRDLSQDVARAIEGTCREISTGMTEYEVQAQLAFKVLQLGINPQVLLVATDERILSYRHPIPTAKKLQRYAMLVICGERGGLVANATRFVHFGPLPSLLQENRIKLAQIDLAFNLATQAGVPITEVFAQGIQEYRRQGFAEDWRILHQGGPTGYATREFLAGPGSKGTVQLHQAFAWNPSIQGLKSEDTLLVTDRGPEFLTDTGEWAYLLVSQNGKVYKRPDILVR